ncbi:hypothetical protein SS50377_22891 [Spironucleus salmonicida]|uniref:Uncharacterized protein n=1 Tax=Spironucleus salmonicida TaxID=348837 RepID=A0A9P8LVB4_9EUKA|nr:hypothetical protein SS50377_22891 [Spironucleus salmonicida]
MGHCYQHIETQKSDQLHYPTNNLIIPISVESINVSFEVSTNENTPELEDNQRESVLHITLQQQVLKYELK